MVPSLRRRLKHGSKDVSNIHVKHGQRVKSSISRHILEKDYSIDVNDLKLIKQVKNIHTFYAWELKDKD